MLDVIESCSKQIENTQSQLESISKEIDEIGVCPYCGSDLKGGSHAECTD